MLIYLILITVAKNTLVHPHQMDVYSQAIHWQQFKLHPGSQTHWPREGEDVLGGVYLVFGAV